MNRSTMLYAAVSIIVGVVALGLLSPAYGQKKKKDSPPAAQPAEPEQQVQPSGKPAGTMRDVLVKLQGQSTNLGILTKVVGDYVVFVSEEDTLMYPLNALQVVKFLKPEEGEPRKIEIKFLARD